MLKLHYTPIIQGHFKAFPRRSNFMPFQTQVFVMLYLKFEGVVRDILHKPSVGVLLVEQATSSSPNLV